MLYKKIKRHIYKYNIIICIFIVIEFPALSFIFPQADQILPKLPGPHKLIKRETDRDVYHN